LAFERRHPLILLISHFTVPLVDLEGAAENEETRSDVLPDQLIYID